MESLLAVLPAGAQQGRRPIFSSCLLQPAPGFLLGWGDNTHSRSINYTFSNYTFSNYTFSGFLALVNDPPTVNTGNAPAGCYALMTGRRSRPTSSSISWSPRLQSGLSGNARGETTH
jgi:hypothetical protein